MIRDPIMTSNKNDQDSMINYQSSNYDDENQSSNDDDENQSPNDDDENQSSNYTP